MTTQVPPGAAPPVGPTGPGGPIGPGPARARRWTGGRVVSLVIGSIIVLVALAVLVGGAGLLVADRAGRDSAGYLTSPAVDMASAGYAVTAGDVRIEGADVAGSWVPESVIGTVRVTAVSRNGARPVFVGIARTAAVDRYLAGVAHGRLRGMYGDVGEVTGTRRPAAPEQVPIWDAASAGPGEQELGWDPAAGGWSLVVMNADGSRGVDATVHVGAQVPWLTGLAVGTIVVGLLLLLVGVVLVVVPLVRASRTPRP